MKGAAPRWRIGALAGAAAILGLILAGCFYWRDDILRNGLDPKVPFQTYTPPPAPDYTQREAWAVLPERPEVLGPEEPAVDVFFVHPTTFDGGRDWNGPVDEGVSRRRLETEILPNYAAPYARIARIFAPRYRQASLYARLTLRDDALESRALAFRDVKRAFAQYLDRWNRGRPIMIVGVGQGGDYAAAIARGVAGDPELADRLVLLHAVQTGERADLYGPGAALPACASPEAVRCAVIFDAAPEFDIRARERLFGKAVVFTPSGVGPEPLGQQPALCVNPVTGAVGQPDAPESRARGAASAQGLEPGVTPPLLPGQVATRCDAGVLRFSRPRSPALQRRGGWAAGLRVAPFNLFYADLEQDAARRLGTWRAAHAPQPAADQSAASHGQSNSSRR